MLGLSGSHRTGKTTLAQAFAAQEGIPFVRTSGSEVFSIIGKDPKVDYPIEERIVIQEAILYAFERQYQAAREQSPFFIADRTPIDLASYLLADVQRTTTAHTPELAGMINDYLSRCFHVASEHFSTIVLVQPGIALVEAEGKAPACPAYVEHMNALQAGLLLDPRLHARNYMIPRKFVALSSRLDCLKNAVSHSIDRAKADKALRSEVGIALH